MDDVVVVESQHVLEDGPQMHLTGLWEADELVHWVCWLVVLADHQESRTS